MNENTVAVELSVAVTDEDIDDIMSTALEGGVNYWCSRVKVLGEYKGEFASEQISAGGTLMFFAYDEDAKALALTKEKLLHGIAMYVKDKPAYDVLSFEKGRYTLDTCMVDASVADCIVQYALFGEVVYG